jgi:tRNA threonylcarbamoyl adenosine modification protein YjeE
MTTVVGGETYALCTVEETEALGRALGRALKAHGAPLVIGLAGPLGAGKTQFARGVIGGVDPSRARDVASPTYAVVHSHETVPCVHHLDLYRLEGDEDLESVGFWELLDDVVVVEWPDRIAAVADLVDIACTLSGQGDAVRTLAIAALTARGHAVVEKLSAT